MIAKIKVTVNNKELRAYEEALQANAQLPKEEQKEIKVVEPIFEEKPLGFDLKDVTLAFVNGDGGISLEYMGKSFNVLYSDDVWNKIQQRFK